MSKSMDKRRVLGGRSLWRICIGVVCLGILLSGVQGQAKENATSGDGPSWSLLTGYSATHPGLGETRTRVESVDVILGYERVLIRGFISFQNYAKAEKMMNGDPNASSGVLRLFNQEEEEEEEG